MVGEDAEEGDAGEGADERGVNVGAAQEEYQGEGWAEELREVGEEVLVVRVDAMLGKIGCVRVVEEIVQGRYHGFREDSREADVTGGI